GSEGSLMASYQYASAHSSAPTEARAMRAAGSCSGGLPGRPPVLVGDLRCTIGFVSAKVTGWIDCWDTALARADSGVPSSESFVGIWAGVDGRRSADRGATTALAGCDGVREGVCGGVSRSDSRVENRRTAAPPRHPRSARIANVRRFNIAAPIGSQRARAY